MMAAPGTLAGIRIMKDAIRAGTEACIHGARWLRQMGFATLLLAVSGLPATAFALPLLVAEPSASEISLSDQLRIDLRISGLESGPTGLSLGAFDLLINFDPTILGFRSVVFGDPLIRDQLDVFGLGGVTNASVDAGVINLFELSLDAPEDLNVFQADSFIVASVLFDTIAAGTTQLGLAVNTLGDAFGAPLDANTQGATALIRGVQRVPEPPSLVLLLLGCGLLVTILMRSKLPLSSDPADRSLS